MFFCYTFFLIRLSVPEKLTYKKDAYQRDAAYLNEFGPQLIHKYAIANDGLIGIEELDVRIVLLNATANGTNSYLDQKNISFSPF